MVRGSPRYRLPTFAACVILLVYSCVRVTLRHQDYVMESASAPTAVDCQTRIIYVGGNNTNVLEYVAPTPKTCKSRDDCGPISCQALIEGDSMEQERAKLYMTFQPRPMPSDASLVTQVSNCSHFHQSQNYALHPATEEEASFPIAYSIVFHKDVAQVERLLHAIYQPQNSYCLHVDSGAGQSVHEAAKALSGCFPNVFIVSKLERVVYAGVSRLQADINCMKDLLGRDASWKYFINLVGQVFPLKTNRELVKILKIYNGANDIEGLPIWRRIKVRYEKRWEEVIPKRGKPVLQKTNITNPPPPHGISLVRGSAYGVFSRGFVEYVIEDEMAKDLLSWSRYTYSPDEHYWATLNHLFLNPQLRTPGGYMGIPDRKPWMAAYASWHPINPCYGKRVRSVCVFGVRDLPQLAERRELFANKFYLDHEYLTMDCLQEWLHNKTAYPLPASFDFYRQLPFVQKTH